MKTTFIYALVDPRTDQIRYVGKSNNLKQRLHNHCNPARYRPTYKFNWIKQLRELGLKPYLIVLDEVEIEFWKFWEKFWIEQCKCWNFNLVNYTEGGEGLTYGNQTSFKKGCKTWNQGTANTKVCEICGEDFIVPPSIAHERRTCSYKCGSKLKKNNNKTHFKDGHTPWNKGKSFHNSNGKIIYQYNLDGELIKKYLSASRAAEEVGVSSNAITSCARGESKTSSGFIWSYKLIENEK